MRGGDPLAISAVAAIDGPVDLKAFMAVEKHICIKRVVAPLLGGSPEQVPDRYHQADPIERRLGRSSVLFSATVLPLGGMAEKYRDLATGEGRQVHVAGA